MVQGLKANPELNGKIGFVQRPMNAEGRYPVQVRGSWSTIAIRSTNIRRLGLSLKLSTEKAPTFKCNAHRLETCYDGYFDFSFMNHISKSVTLCDKQLETLVIQHFARPDESAESITEEHSSIKQAIEMLHFLEIDIEDHQRAIPIVAAAAGMAFLNGRVAAQAFGKGRVNTNKGEQHETSFLWTLYRRSLIRSELVCGLR